LQLVQTAKEVHVAQLRGHWLQVVPDKKNPVWQLKQDVCPLQFSQGSEQAIQFGEFKKYLLLQAVQVYPEENAQTLHPAGQGSHPFDTK
jgi:hypothetical protein